MWPKSCNDTRLHIADMSCLSRIVTGQRYGGLAHCKITQLSCEWWPQQALCLPQQNKVQRGASCGQSIDLYSMLSRCPLCWCLCSCIYQLFSCNCNPRDFWLDIRRRGLNAFCVPLLSAPSLGLACQSGASKTRVLQHHHLFWDPASLTVTCSIDIALVHHSNSRYR